MSISTVIRDEVAIALVVLYQDQERIGTFSNRSAAPVTLYMDYQPESMELAQELGFEVEKTARKFFIPRQTSFPPSTGVNAGDAITVESKAYQVERVEQAGDDSPQFEVTCSREIAVSGGVQ